jgi:hypothetical protein
MQKHTLFLLFPIYNLLIEPFICIGKIVASLYHLHTGSITREEAPC